MTRHEVENSARDSLDSVLVACRQNPVDSQLYQLALANLLDYIAIAHGGSNPVKVTKK